jgi:hypothetical protein
MNPQLLFLLALIRSWFRSHPQSVPHGICRREFLGRSGAAIAGALLVQAGLDYVVTDRERIEIFDSTPLDITDLQAILKEIVEKNIHPQILRNHYMWNGFYKGKKPREINSSVRSILV